MVSIIADELCQRGWEVAICLLLSNQVEYSINPQVKIVDMTGDMNLSRLKRLPGWIREIRCFTKKYKPDVILSFVARINIIAQLATLGLKIPIIVSERNDPKSDGRGILVDFMTRLLYPHAKSVVFQTKRAQGYFSESVRKNSVIITNPIEVSSYRKNVTRGKVVTVGRLMPQKNHIMLIDAFAQLCCSFQEMELYIYGEGYLYGHLEAYAEKLGVKTKVHLMGNVRDIHNQISDAEMFVLSSDYEGLSNALLEAMMLSIPCISTRCAGSDEYIINNENGLLVDVGDKSALVEAMIKLHLDPDCAKRLGLSARESSKLFERKNVIDKWCEITEP